MALQPWVLEGVDAHLCRNAKVPESLVGAVTARNEFKRHFIPLPRSNRALKG
jgi:hypothetical protein